MKTIFKENCWYIRNDFEILKKKADKFRAIWKFSNKSTGSNDFGFTEYITYDCLNDKFIHTVLNYVDYGALTEDGSTLITQDEVDKLLSTFNEQYPIF